MKPIMKRGAAGFLAVIFCLAMGCRATTREHDPKTLYDEKRLENPGNRRHYDEKYDATDKHVIVNNLADSLLKADFPLEGPNRKPVFIVYDIANRTDQHIDTGGIADDIQDALFKSGRFDFVGKTQRESIREELNYQYGGNVSPHTRVAKARQVGADYMLTGTLRSIEKEQPPHVRLKKRKLQYYNLNLEVTDLETGLLVWKDKAEIVRESSRPLIGW